MYHPKKGLFHKWQYKYHPEKDIYTCPGGSILTYRTTTREGYREYKSYPEVCQNCQFLLKCTHSKGHVKTITKHVWEEEEEKEWVRLNRLSPKGKELYKRRKETIEHSFPMPKNFMD
ncbi:MAG: transposase [Thermoanaerobacteraceae bacterium]|nr:transposase [Thermoanaerobacteraceae bacterium]